MLRYTIHRVLLMIPTLFGVALLIFFMLRVVPGDIIELKLRGDGGTASASIVEQERERLGLNKPLPVQFVLWIKGVVTLDMGVSLWTNRPVMEEIGIRIGLTLQVALMAAVIAAVIAIPLGNALGAVSRHLDRLPAADLHDRRLGGALVLACHDDHPAAAVDVLLGAPGHLHVDLRGSGRQPVAADLARAGGRLSLSPPWWRGIVRSSIIEVMREDYIRTARAKGLFEKTWSCGTRWATRCCRPSPSSRSNLRS